MSSTIAFIVGVPAILIAIVVHEFCHGLAAYLLGDNTAKDAGRLTLNPIPHIDLWGTIIIPLIMLVTSGAAFGWAKPVPFNPYNLKYQRFGPALVAMAGPFSNLIIAIISFIAFKALTPNLDQNTNLLMIFLINLLVLNLFLMIFNLIPIPPLDGSKVLFAIFADARYVNFRDLLERQGPIILLVLIVFDNFLNLGIFNFIFKAVFNLLNGIL
ncbi:MAG: site-2 protease family protein [Patescibacteria group bacterium]